MSTGATVVVITLSSLSLLTSGATLAVVLIGAKKAEQKIEEVQDKTNKSLNKFKNALSDLEF